MQLAGSLLLTLLFVSLCLVGPIVANYEYCGRYNVVCSKMYNPIMAWITPKKGLRFAEQVRLCQMECRNINSYYVEASPTHCYCLDTCYNMAYVTDGKSHIWTINTEIQYDPNNICPHGYMKLEGRTCPQDINVPLGRYNTRFDSLRRNDIDCKNECGKKRGANYYEVSLKHCFCFQTCSGIKGSNVSPNRVGLVHKDYDPSLTSGQLYG